ncbi:helix-turn-helix transcriptional regulator [Streptomyces rimosus]|uniref:helix-turn-helix domain-containing protein n=1 Tax=Streptomyces rimosus TaxID=1927 RepID=UPI0006C3181D|nr:helix-turn-helix transcriptional regulator [Streptomyces rimosus]KOT93251.1 DNA-binding protein [Streptomyces rimosus subsp. pseudoverticillatus]
MPKVPAQPPMTWRYCGDQLKLWRTYAGVSREEIAKEADYDAEYVKSMEQGRRRPTLRMLQIADQVCRAHGMLEAAHEYLKPDKCPQRSSEFMDLEKDAIALHWYESLLIPGLLQTEEYVREVMSNPSLPVDDETVESRINFRLQRQKKLEAVPDVLFSFIIYEAALRSMVGGADLMKRQIDRLLEAQGLRNVSVQVLPIGRAPYAALSGPVVLLETAEHEMYSYSSGQGASVLQSEPGDVSRLMHVYGMMRMQALGTEETDEYIREVAKSL